METQTLKPNTPDGYMVPSSAVLSPDGKYRFQLFRRWTTGSRFVCWIMLNPSTADAEKDDATIRRIRNYAIAWGYDGLCVVNLYALRSTVPTHLWYGPDPVGEGNDKWILDTAERCDLIVCGWGQPGPLPLRPKAVFDMLTAAGYSLFHLVATAKGHPGHPLRLLKTLKPKLYMGPK